MKRVALILFATSTLSAVPATSAATISRKAVAFDLSAPLTAMEQFIPEKRVTIHPAVQSKAETAGSMKGPGAGLGSTPPNVPAARGGPGAGRGAAARGGRSAAAPAPRITAPPAPEIGAVAAGIEQKEQGSRAALAVGASFDGLGEGFVGNNGYTGGDRGGIDISLAVGPDHIVEILNGNMAVFMQEGEEVPRHRQAALWSGAEQHGVYRLRRALRREQQQRHGGALRPVGEPLADRAAGVHAAAGIIRRDRMPCATP